MPAGCREGLFKNRNATVFSSQLQEFKDGWGVHPSLLSRICLLCPGGDKAHDEGETLLNKQPRKGQNGAKCAVVTRLAGCVNKPLLRLGTGGGNACPGCAASSAGGEWRFKSGWPPCGFVFCFSLNKYISIYIHLHCSRISGGWACLSVCLTYKGKPPVMP